MFDNFSRIILPTGIIILLIFNTISTCSSKKLQQDVDTSLKSIELGQYNIKSAINKIDSANTGVKVSIDSLNALENRLRNAQDQILKLDEAFKKSMSAGEAAAKEIEKQIKADQQNLNKFKWPN